MDNKNQNQGEINIELPEDVSGGTYANLAVITHSNSEFILDFIRMMPGVPKAKVKSRIILTPQHAKRLMLALQDNIRKYEATFGDIQDFENGMKIPMNLGPSAQA